MEHCTRFLPVEGLINWAAMLMGGEPQRLGLERPELAAERGELAGELTEEEELEL